MDTKTHPQHEFLRVWKYAQAEVPLNPGSFVVSVYRNNEDSVENVAISKGQWTPEQPVFVRIHSECMTGEVLGSLKCDCKAQLDGALATIAHEGCGVVIYLRQEGRGIGLGNKIKAYDLQNQGLDTVDANQALGFPTDSREFKVAALMLRDLGIKKIKINTNNPDKIKAMQTEGFEVCEVVPSLAPLTPHNQEYLHTKLNKLGHKLSKLFD